MALDRYTHERLAHCHIADSQSFAEQLRTLDRIEEGRRQGKQLQSTPRVMRLLRSLTLGHIPTLSTLQRAVKRCRKENDTPSPNSETSY